MRKIRKRKVGKGAHSISQSDLILIPSLPKQVCFPIHCPYCRSLQKKELFLYICLDPHRACLLFSSDWALRERGECLLRLPSPNQYRHNGIPISSYNIVVLFLMEMDFSPHPQLNPEEKTGHLRILATTLCSGTLPKSNIRK